MPKIKGEPLYAKHLATGVTYLCVGYSHIQERQGPRTVLNKFNLVLRQGIVTFDVSYETLVGNHKTEFVILDSNGKGVFEL